jgi:hypothetical protein
MKTVRLVALLALAVCWLSSAVGQPDLPPAAREVLTQFEQEATDLDRKATADIGKCRERGAAELRKIQDELIRAEQLEEAAALKTLIRLVELGAPVALPPGLPSGVRKAYRDYEEEVSIVFEKAEAEYIKRRDKTAAELKKIQDVFCKEAKLDEALAVRDRIRAISVGKVTALPDPGYVNYQPTDIGKTFYYQVTGTGTNQGFAIYGTDVYIIGSHLGTAAVHCGLLKEGEKGVVKVTIVPGQDSYPATTRNGVTSQPAGRAEYGFKVERVYSFQVKPFLDFLPKGKRKKDA